MLQIGSALAIAIVTSIQTSMQIKHDGPNGFPGRAAALWFLVAALALMMVLFAIFIKDTVGPVDPSAPPVHKDSKEEDAAPPAES